MDWLDPFRQDTERIRQETIKIKEETIKIKEETEKLREENKRLREGNKQLKNINLKELVNKTIKQPKSHMKIFLDTADVELIKPAYDTGLIDGITTNPTLILKSGRQLKEVIIEISESFPELESISAEVVGDTGLQMLKQAEEYRTISNVTIKVPCTVEGLKVCAYLHDNQYANVNVTLVFSVSQAILAAKANATYISPFVGRLEDQSFDGLSLIKNIREVNNQMGTKTKILAASIRDIRQVEQCAKYGADVVTIPPLVFWKMYTHSFTEAGIEQFNKDFSEANTLEDLHLLLKKGR